MSLGLELTNSARLASHLAAGILLFLHPQRITKTSFFPGSGVPTQFFTLAPPVLTDSSLPSPVLVSDLSSLHLPLSSVFQVCGLWRRICVNQGQEMQKEIDGDREEGAGSWLPCVQ